MLCLDSEGGWLFPSPVTGRPYHADSIRADYLVPTGLQLGLGRIGFHSFRHTYRAWLDETGAPVGVQQKLMRHAHVSTTMDQYGNASALAKRKANRPIVQRLLRRSANQQSGELWSSSPYWTVLDSRCKCPIARNLMIALVAGARYVPNRQLLSIPFRSELIHCVA